MQISSFTVEFIDLSFIFLEIKIFSLSISGDGILLAYLAVKNICYQKVVGIRMTHNSWESFQDVLAEHVITTGGQDIFVVRKKIEQLSSLKDSISNSIEFVGFVEYKDNMARHWSFDTTTDNRNHSVSNVIIIVVMVKDFN